MMFSSKCTKALTTSLTFLPLHVRYPIRQVFFFNLLPFSIYICPNIHVGQGNCNRSFNIIFPSSTGSYTTNPPTMIRFNPFLIFSQIPTPGAIENHLVNIRNTRAILIQCRNEFARMINIMIDCIQS